MEYENHPTKGEITIEKRGEVLEGYEGGWFADSDEKEFVYVEGGLEGAEFEVYAAEDIYTADHIFNERQKVEISVIKKDSETGK